MIIRCGGGCVCQPIWVEWVVWMYEVEVSLSLVAPSLASSSAILLPLIFVRALTFCIVMFGPRYFLGDGHD